MNSVFNNGVFICLAESKYYCNPLILKIFSIEKLNLNNADIYEKKSTKTDNSYFKNTRTKNKS